jgi:hypothetical protein
MIIDNKNETQKSILTNKCFYQTTAQIMYEFERRGYVNSADETAKVFAAYHDLVQKKSKNVYNKDYNDAFRKIDEAIKGLANKVFYGDAKALDVAYKSFVKFDYVNAILGRQQVKKKS